MAIIETITDEYHFAEWCKQAKARDSSYGHFTLEGAKALQAYFEDLSEDMGESIEFDPIAWCVEFSEYKDFDEFKHDNGYTVDGVEHDGYEDIKTLEDLQDHTTVIEFDGGILVAEF